MTQKKIKVAYILTPITFGGAEKVSLNFLRTVDRSRFDIHPVLLVRPWENDPYFARELDVLGYAYQTVPVALVPGEGPLRVIRVARRFYAALKNGAFDLVHTHGYFADICSLPVARLLGIRSIATCHGFIENDNKLKIYNRLDAYALRLCRKIIAVSEGIRDGLVQNGIRDSRIVVIPNAVASSFDEKTWSFRRQKKREALSIAPTEFAVGYIGRLSEEKGLLYLVEAVADLHNSGVPVKLIVVGDGPQKALLEDMVKTKSIEKQVIFTGFQTDIEHWLPAIDVFSLPSVTEGTPMALLEAMAGGVPVIATAVGGVPKIVTDGVNGLLVPPRDSQALIDKIQWIRNNVEKTHQIAKTGIDTIKTKYDIDEWCRVVEQHYIEV